MQQYEEPRMKLASKRIVALALISTSLAVTWLGLNSADAANATAPRQGDWTMRPAGQPGAVQFALMTTNADGSSRYESTVPTSGFEDLDLSLKGRQEASFSVVREAGRFDFEGHLEESRGAGTFRFSPDPAFATKLRALGFTVDANEHFWMAIHDVTSVFAEQMSNAGLKGLDSDKLLAFRVHGVNLPYIESLRATGQEISDSDTLIAFQVHGVSPEGIRAVRQAGYEPDNDLLIAMRVHGVTPEWIERITGQGFTDIDLDHLIAFRVHGVSPLFMEELRDLGYSDLDADNLIAFRVHGVTPGGIRALQSEGAKFDADELIAARIHDISPEFIQQARSNGKNDLDFQSLLQLKMFNR